MGIDRSNVRSCCTPGCRSRSSTISRRAARRPRRAGSGVRRCSTRLLTPLSGGRCSSVAARASSPIRRGWSRPCATCAISIATVPRRPAGIARWWSISASSTPPRTATAATSASAKRRACRTQRTRPTPEGPRARPAAACARSLLSVLRGEDTEKVRDRGRTFVDVRIAEDVDEARAARVDLQLSRRISAPDRGRVPSSASAPAMRAMRRAEWLRQRSGRKDKATRSDSAASIRSRARPRAFRALRIAPPRPSIAGAAVRHLQRQDSARPRACGRRRCMRCDRFTASAMPSSKRSAMRSSHRSANTARPRHRDQQPHRKRARSDAGKQSGHAQQKRKEMVRRQHVHRPEQVAPVVLQILG